MRLYHLIYKTFLVALLTFVLVGCDAPRVTQALIEVTISADGSTATISMPAGSTVQELLQTTGVTINPLDRTDPPLYTALVTGSHVQVIRVTEEFVVEQNIIPFDTQVVRNESLPEGETRLIQPGVNGIEEFTIRRVYEDGVEVSSNQVKSVVLQEPTAEVVMVGSQNPFTPLSFPGKLVYLASGNAWLMDGISSNRRPIITTGDLDGRILKLSSDKNWLLFTRYAVDDENINTLWAARITEQEPILIDLQINNIIHFADWVPQSTNQIAYSTVEPREAPPGWQANNNLVIVSFSENGWVSKETVILEDNSGGIYGWWGTSYSWAEDGQRLVYTRPDSVGIINLEGEDQETVEEALEIIPLQAQGDWAWVPGAAWSPVGNYLYTVDHVVSSDVGSPEASPLFDLTAVPLFGGAPITIVSQVGMFAYPTPSPIRLTEGTELSHQIAYLQAIFPTQSDSSRYRLVVMDRDGSNRKMIFPNEGAAGLDPQQVVWSPETFGENGSFWVGLIYQGNLWMVDTTSGDAQQLTGDGLIDRFEWR